MFYALAAVAGDFSSSFLPMLAGGLVHVLDRLLQILFWCIFIVIIASFFVQTQAHPVLGLLRQITEPILAPARKLLPAMGGLDFSPILVILLLEVGRQMLVELSRGLY
jgi:YggT family protein